jgi:hypothetical protein
MYSEMEGLEPSMCLLLSSLSDSLALLTKFYMSVRGSKPDRNSTVYSAKAKDRIISFVVFTRHYFNKRKTDKSNC